MVESSSQVYLTAWRRAEERFYGSVMTNPDLYTTAIQLVRGIADSLRDIDTPEALLEAYPHIDISQIAAIAESLDLNLRDFIDYALARDAAFFLRYQEIAEANLQAEMQARIAAARVQGEAWVTLYDNETLRQGYTFFQRLEMHLPDGLGLYSGVELDWEKGRVYVVEPVVLDPATGLLQKGISPPESRQEFGTREEMMATLATLRKKYSSGDTEENSED